MRVLDPDGSLSVGLSENTRFARRVFIARSSMPAVVVPTVIVLLLYSHQIRAGSSFVEATGEPEGAEN